MAQSESLLLGLHLDTNVNSKEQSSCLSGPPSVTAICAVELLAAQRSSGRDQVTHIPGNILFASEQSRFRPNDGTGKSTALWPALGHCIN